MTRRQKYYISSFIVGMVLAILFSILAKTVGGSSPGAYIAAAATSGLAGIVGLILFFVHR